MTRYDDLRTWLYAPADNPALLTKALTSGADAVIADLEDAVSADAKRDARASLAQWLDGIEASATTSVWVRIDAASIDADLAVACHPRVAGICLPKAETVATIQQVDATLTHLDAPHNRDAPTSLMLLIETAAGVLSCQDLAVASPRVAVLQIGELDLRANLGLLPQHLAPDRLTLPRPLKSAREVVVLVSAAAGLVPPVAPVAPDFRDVSALAAETAQLRADGFGSRAAIHPAQLAPIVAAFTPSPAEIAWATAVLEAASTESGVAVLDGRMIDAPVIKQAEILLRRANR